MNGFLTVGWVLLGKYKKSQPPPLLASSPLQLSCCLHRQMFYTNIIHNFYKQIIGAVGWSTTSPPNEVFNLKSVSMIILANCRVWMFPFKENLYWAIYQLFETPISFFIERSSIRQIWKGLSVGWVFSPWCIG